MEALNATAKLLVRGGSGAGVTGKCDCRRDILFDDFEEAGIFPIVRPDEM